jgi:hypothetical protein
MKLYVFVDRPDGQAHISRWNELGSEVLVGTIEVQELKKEMGEISEKEVLSKIDKATQEQEIIRQMEAKGYAVHRLFGGALVFEAPKPKKTVVKEVPYKRVVAFEGDLISGHVPPNAQNVSLTYEVDE